MAQTRNRNKGCDAVRQGLAEYAVDAAAADATKAHQEEEKGSKFQALFNEASQLREGLDCLKTVPGSTFDYQIIEECTLLDGRPVLQLKTNIPDQQYSWIVNRRALKTPPTKNISFISIIVRDGKCRAQFNKELCWEPLNNPQEMIKFVAKLAAQKGLVPATVK